MPLSISASEIYLSSPNTMHNISPKILSLAALKYPRTAKDIVLDTLLYREKLTPFPRLINCFVTEACNFKCPMCHVVTSRQKNQSHLSFSDFKKVVAESKHFSPSFQLAGGEPLLHPDIIKMTKLLDENKIIKLLVTNGLLLEEKAQALIDAGLDFLAVSLDGPNEETQYRRGYVKGSFTKIVKGIQKIITLKKGRPFPHIRIATVISKYNLTNFDQILTIARDLGVDQWSLSHHYYYFDKIKKQQNQFAQKHNLKNDIWGEYISHSNYLNKKERLYLDQKLKLIVNHKIKNNLSIALPSNLNVESYYTGQYPGINSSCSSPYRQIYLRGNGDIEICQGNIIGNINSGFIRDAWNGDKANYFRSVFKKNKNMPGCFRCCSLNIKFD